MAKYTLAKFLQGENRLQDLQKAVFSSIMYLRSVLGDAFFTDPDKKEFWSDVGESDLLGSEYGEFTMRGDASPEWMEGAQDRERMIAFHNIDFLRQHLEIVERLLLGSRTLDGKESLTCHGDVVAPVPRNVITPFAALLGKDQVDCSPDGGAVGGFDPNNEVHVYQTPVDGQNRVLSLDALNTRLEGLRQLGETPSKTHLLFAHMASFAFLPEFAEEPWTPGGGYLSDRRYMEVQERTLQPGYVPSILMPGNAIYLVAPKRVCIHAAPICEVTTDETDTVVVRAFSRIAHSLLHHRDLEVRRASPDTPLMDLERYHAAFLAVTDPKRGGSGD